MRGMSKAAKAEAYDKEHEACTLAQLALNDVINSAVEGECRRGDYSVQLLRLDGAHGGLVIFTYRAVGQPGHSTAHYFEAWITETRRVCAHMGVSTPETLQERDDLLALCEWAWVERSKHWRNDAAYEQV